MIEGYEKIAALVRNLGAAFCLSGAGPTMLCITRDETLREKLEAKLPTLSQPHPQILPLHVEFQGACQV